MRRTASATSGRIPGVHRAMNSVSVMGGKRTWNDLRSASARWIVGMQIKTTTRIPTTTKVSASIEVSSTRVRTEIGDSVIYERPQRRPSLLADWHLAVPRNRVEDSRDRSRERRRMALLEA